jgi:hypothetical protein
VRCSQRFLESLPITNSDSTCQFSTLIYDDEPPESTEMNPETHHIDRADRDLRRWLATQARAGVPELVLIALLRSYARRIERHGYIPRSWIDPTPTEWSEDPDGF